MWKTSLNFCFFLRKRNNHYQVCEVQRFERHVFAPSGEANTIVFPSRRINWRKNELSTFDCPLSEWIFFWRLWKKKRIIQLTLVVFGFGNRLATELKKTNGDLRDKNTIFKKQNKKRESRYQNDLILLNASYPASRGSSMATARSKDTRERENWRERQKNNKWHQRHSVVNGPQTI